ncbi:MULTISPECIES: Holliday junction resolvase Hjc [Metallosphaera]|uniref:Crossover junction endodeoxyribonuclease Hjc n=3 Tax=Metallosphaera TaxID=41980 RepID=A4YI14_METS5|nr:MULTISPECIES: Holliday junction resolvase Hjc [Metallosphaera]ABP96066.1 holliday junction resolvase [Metallosphaera sedula DSM 5348]AIM28050.1 holliday junction resolvase [Metallosphaera sedula]AKV74883.1 endonuclease [Metallosphaera sedula]AKV77120.1 endonuclease [Metallosphaera sedula]AKV79371.1 endonuclease [Metallosphaera sedula]
MNQRKARGSNVERYILSLLRDRGFAVIRSPASGSKRKDPAPDIVALKMGVILLIEVKSRKREGHVYITREQADGIMEFSRRSGGELFLAVKNPKMLKFIRFQDLKRTDGGNYVATQEVIEKGIDIDGLSRYVESKFSKTLDTFL